MSDSAPISDRLGATDAGSVPPVRVRAPEVKGWPIAGVAWEMRRDPLGVMTRGVEAHGDVVYMRLGPYQAHLFRHPDDIKRVLVDNEANYSKQTRGFQKARLVLGQGLVTSEGALWQRQRRIATPAFHRHRVAGFGKVFTDGAESMLVDWQRRAAARPDEPIDVFVEMMRVTLGVAVRALLGSDAGDRLDELSRAVTRVLEHTNDIITNILSAPLWVPTSKNRSFKRELGKLDRFVFDTIARRREAKDYESRADLLSMFMSTRDEQTGEGMSDQLLRDEAVTTLIAGHETTAITLTWASHLLAAHPAARARLEDELESVLGGRTPTFDDLPKLRYTRAVIDESLRLYPPAWMIARRATGLDVVGGYPLKPGMVALVSPFVTHRSPNLWNDPLRFDPDRFLEGGEASKVPRFAYLPFGAGPRFCVGATFALTEATLMLATIAQRFRLEAVEGFAVELFAMITLRPKNGLLMRVKPRDL